MHYTLVLIVSLKLIDYINLNLKIIILLFDNLLLFIFRCVKILDYFKVERMVNTSD